MMSDSPLINRTVKSTTAISKRRMHPVQHETAEIMKGIHGCGFIFFHIEDAQLLPGTISYRYRYCSEITA